MIVTLQATDATDDLLRPHVLFCFPHEVLYPSSINVSFNSVEVITSNVYYCIFLQIFHV